MHKLTRFWPLFLFFPILVLLGMAGKGPSPAFVSSELTVEISDASLTFINSNGDMVPQPNETWLVKGRVTQVDGQPGSGTFYCWGVFLDEEVGSPAGFTAYIQRIQIDGQGTLMVSGAEFSSEPMVVVGGTGKFLGATGSYTDGPMFEGNDVDGDGEPEMAGAPIGIDLDGDGDNDGDGNLVKNFNILLPQVY